VTITIGPEALWLAGGIVLGVALTVFAALVLGAYGHEHVGIRVSPTLAVGLRSAFRTMAYSAAGVIAANAGNWLAALLIHFSVPAPVATAAGLVLTGAFAGGHQTMQARAQLRAAASGNGGTDPSIP
jgi:hypothetical protein